jgi:hypothetical protein
MESNVESLSSISSRGAFSLRRRKATAAVLLLRYFLRRSEKRAARNFILPVPEADAYAYMTPVMPMIMPGMMMIIIPVTVAITVSLFPVIIMTRIIAFCITS